MNSTKWKRCSGFLTAAGCTRRGFYTHTPLKTVRKKAIKVLSKCRLLAFILSQLFAHFLLPCQLLAHFLILSQLLAHFLRLSLLLAHFLTAASCTRRGFYTPPQNGEKKSYQSAIKMPIISIHTFSAFCALSLTLSAFSALSHTFSAFSTLSQLLAHFLILSQLLAHFLNF